MVYFVRKMMDDEPGTGGGSDPVEPGTGGGSNPAEPDEPGGGGGSDPEPEEKEYGYARDMADINDPSGVTIPGEVTENFITFYKSNHFAVPEESAEPSDNSTIYNHGYEVEISESAEPYIKVAYEGFDAEARQNVAEAINPPEDADPSVNDDPNAPVS